MAGEWVYVADRTGTIFRLPKAGGELEAIATDQDLPLSLAVAGDHLYWANYWDGRIMRLRL